MDHVDMFKDYVIFADTIPGFHHYGFKVRHWIQGQTLVSRSDNGYRDYTGILTTF